MMVKWKKQIEEQVIFQYAGYIRVFSFEEFQLNDLL